VVSVAARDDYRLRVTFSSGEIGIFDCTPLLNFGVFRELRDLAYFRQARASGGTVVWPHEQDICPDTLYEDSVRGADGSGTMPRKSDGATLQRPERQAP
jgi:hypothetical protein